MRRTKSERENEIERLTNRGILIKAGAGAKLALSFLWSWLSITLSARGMDTPRLHPGIRAILLGKSTVIVFNFWSQTLTKQPTSVLFSF